MAVKMPTLRELSERSTRKNSMREADLSPEARAAAQDIFFNLSDRRTGSAKLAMAKIVQIACEDFAAKARAAASAKMET